MLFFQISYEMTGFNHNEPQQPSAPSSGTGISTSTKTSPSILAPARQTKTLPAPRKSISMDSSKSTIMEQHRDTNHSSADEEVPVESPVRGNFRRPTPLCNKKRPRQSSENRSDRSSRSSSPSSTNDDEPSHSPNKKTTIGYKERDKDGTRYKQRKVSDARSESSRSNSRSIRSDSGRRVEDREKTPTNPQPRLKKKTSDKRIKTAPEDDLEPIDEPSDIVIEENDRLFRKMRENVTIKPSRRNAETSSCAATSVRSTKSTRDSKPSPGIGQLSLEYLFPCLRQDLRKNMLARRSVQLLWTNHVQSRIRDRQVINMVRNMYTVPSTEVVDTRLWDNDNFLLCTFNNTFGYDQEALEKCKDYADRSLASALFFNNCKRGKHALDMVFRQGLKEIADEMYKIDRTSNVSMDNPVCISGQYLELRLLQKIRDYYKTHFNGKDISNYLTQSCVDTHSCFHEHVSNNAAEKYIRTLYDRYQLRSDTFDEAMKTFTFAPTKLRVWTDVETQTSVNSAITNFLKQVYSDKRFDNFGTITETIDYCTTAMKSFVIANSQFIAEVCKASELFAWMCLGVVTDDVENGPMFIAAGYHLLKMKQVLQEKSDIICWNYPLASMYDRELPDMMVRNVNKPKFTEGLLAVLEDQN